MYQLQTKRSNTKNKIRLHEKYRNSRTATACSKIPAAREAYLPGGALISTLGKWAGRLIASGSDDMGRCAWQKLVGKGGKTIQIISAYQVSQKSMPGPTTAYTQQ